MTRLMNSQRKHCSVLLSVVLIDSPVIYSMLSRVRKENILSSWVYVLICSV